VRRLEGKVAIVTGGGSGIGRATALRLAAEGAAVAIAEIDEQRASTVAEEVEAQGGRALAIPTDVADEASISAAVEMTAAHFGGVDVLHNNAALLSPDFLERDGDILEFDPEVFDRAMGVNLRGAILATKHSLPRLFERGGGSIVNTVSIGALRGAAVRPVYRITKAGLVSFTTYVAAAYGRRGVRCNAVAPGAIVTPASVANNPDRKTEDRLALHLTTRLGEPEDVAAAVAFLVSDDAGFITAQTLVVDGGRISYMQS
jgi:NAD(P)-dependent dehydrogenase (short-subunit alcohol dehydrogenase family)